VERLPVHTCGARQPGNPDPAAGLRQAANIQRRQFEAMLDITVHQEAARTDPEICHIMRSDLGIQGHST